MNLPDEYMQNMQILLKDDYEKYINSLQQEPVSGIRLDKIKTDETILSEFEIVKKVPYTNNGYISKTEKIGKHPYHIAGLVYSQEPSSMMPVCASKLQEENLQDIKVLDLCAAPGGKTGQIAEILKGQGVIVSNEIETKRAKILQSNVERMGYTNVIITNNTPEKLAQELPTMFDYIFVDAPCGGEGMFRKDPSTILEWKQERLESNSRRQKEILAEANKMLKPNGKIVYSTCTFSKVEDEDVCNWFAKTYDYSFESVPNEVENNTTFLDNKSCRRFYPFLSDGEGQFVCVMKKNDGEFVQKRPYKTYKMGKSELGILDAFLKTNFNLDFDLKYAKIGGNYCIINENLQKMLDNMQKLAIINAGVTVGSIEKNRLVVHHNVFTALGKLSKQKINFTLDDLSLQKYLHGEELQNESLKNGYGVVCVNGCPIGGVKVIDSRLKNMFPKGLRL